MCYESNPWGLPLSEEENAELAELGIIDQGGEIVILPPEEEDSE